MFPLLGSLGDLEEVRSQGRAPLAQNMHWQSPPGPAHTSFERHSPESTAEVQRPCHPDVLALWLQLVTDERKQSRKIERGGNHTLQRLLHPQA